MKKFDLEKFDNIMKKILITFFIIQPIFDMTYFYNSISTLIRAILVFAIFAYYFITSKNNKKYLLLIYPAIVRNIFCVSSYQCFTLSLFSAWRL